MQTRARTIAVMSVGLCIGLRTSPQARSCATCAGPRSIDNCHFNAEAWRTDGLISCGSGP